MPAQKTMCRSGKTANVKANVTLCRELALASLDGEDDVFSLVEVLLQ